jgi:hypothetical protein
MAKDYVDQRATRTRASAETRGRQTAEKDQGPYSPEAIDKLYDKGEYAPFHETGGDGLVDAKQHAFDVKIQKPQFPEDQHLPGYDNDVPERRRGGRQGSERATFDTGKLDPGNKPGRWASGGGKNTASGTDCKSSPFSAAHFKGRGEG